ncbi:MAG: FtsQ-type POTRA domain-containing protein [Desulfamplus sp.]|nr:FtsQ-type POTRA domain-containing protein [Desulfamplus sp.]
MNKKKKENRYRPPTGGSSVPSIDFMGPLEVGLKVIFLIILLTVTTLFFIFVENAATQSSTFSLSSVSVSGNLLIPSKEIIEQADIHTGDNILDLNLKHVRLKLISHPWIEDAAVKRVLPSEIAITVREQKAIALVRIEETADIIMNVKGEPFSENDGMGGDVYHILSQLHISSSQDSRTPYSSTPYSSTQKFNAPDSLRPLPIVKGLKLHLDENGQYSFSGRLHKAVMEILYMDKEEMDINTISVDSETGMEIKGTIQQIPQEPFPHNGQIPYEPMVTINLGFDNFKEKLKKIRHIVKYMQENSPDKQICSIDLINPENIVIQIIKGDRLLGSLQGGV